MIKQLLKLGFFMFAILALALSCSKDSTKTDDDEDHFEAVGLKIRQNGVDIVSYQNGQVNGEIEAQEGLTTTLLSVRFIDGEGNEGVPQGDEYSMLLTIQNGAIAGIVQHAGEDWSFHIQGKAAGHTTLTIAILHGDHADFESAPIPVHVEGGGMHGEPVGLVLIEEASGDTLAKVDAGVVTGQINVAAGQASGHIVTHYFDDQGVFFQPDPAEHSQEYTVADTTIAVVESHGGETYELEVEGKSAGSTTFRILLRHAGNPEFETPDIPILVAP